MTYRSAFNNRPHSWRPSERPQMAATKMPCAGGCGKWIAMNPKRMCRYCDEQRIRAEREAKIMALKRLEDLRELPRDIVIDGIEYTVIWAGRGPLPGSGDTPGNLGASLLNSSRIVS